MTIEKLKSMIEKSDNIVFFGGAGVSTESGIPDFRSETGLYSNSKKKRRGPKYIYTYKYYEENKEEYLLHYKKNMIDTVKNSVREPNAAHKALTELEKRGKLKVIITQNVDGLHQKAGSKKIIELHGSTNRCFCEDCNAKYSLIYFLNARHIAKCEKCGGLVRPDIVMYGEKLDDNLLEEARNYVSNSDLFIVGGTSLVVYPAAGLLRYYKGDKLVIINKTETKFDYKANLLFNDNIGEILSSVV
ncbi:MAG: NAD-dependent protein deacylase [Tissierellia bacterium]|nr:NAD-dependent protein deacylase [Tissierellia bacterium]MDD4725247.1 NAD-dependent protein deacylase [Tissierellia bacterium]